MKIPQPALIKTERTLRTERQSNRKMHKRLTQEAVLALRTRGVKRPTRQLEIDRIQAARVSKAEEVKS